MKLLLASVLAATLLIAGCGGLPAAPAETPGSLTPPPGFVGPEDTGPIRHEIGIVDFGYEPESYELSAGQAVMWMNAGNVPHTVTFEDAGIDSGRLSAGETFQHTFDEAGAFEYVCTIHPQMRGTLTVGP